MKSLKEYINDELDREITRSVMPLVDKVQQLFSFRGTLFQRALAALDEHAAMLEEAGEKLKQNDPYLIAVIEQWEKLMGTAVTLLEVESETIALAGANLAEPVFRASIASSLAASDPEVERLYAEATPEEEKERNPLAAAAQKALAVVLVGLGLSLIFPNDKSTGFTTLDIVQKFTGSDAWRNKLDKLASGYSGKLTELVIRSIAEGWGASKLASQLRRAATMLPAYVIEGLARTLVLTAYREATSVTEKLNSDYLLYKLRIATLDVDTCLACIALHGTKLEIGERVDDHYRGRCDEFIVVAGGALHPEMMQVDSTPGERHFVPWQTGVEWLNSLPLNRLKQQASFASTPAKLNAFLEGVPLEAFVGSHTDPVFGNMVVENSLKGAIGEDEAKEYYVRNYGKPPDL